MRKTILPAFIFLAISLFGQNHVGSVNSSALSNNGMVFSVGEIYVLPETRANESNSGLMAILSRIEFFTSGINEQLSSDDVRMYPNPACNSVFMENGNSHLVDKVFIYNNNGKLIQSQSIGNNRVDVSSLVPGTYFI